MATFCCVAQKAASAAQAHLNKSDKIENWSLQKLMIVYSKCLLFLKAMAMNFCWGLAAQLPYSSIS
jgi:hypothetical protein